LYKYNPLKTPAIIILSIFFGGLTALAASFPEKGVPLLQNYTPAQYHNRGKVWDIGSVPNGIVYFAADGGLLEYDGKTWRVFRGSNGFTRSIRAVSDSLIYTGSDLDFGIWKRNKYQTFDYISLYPFRDNAFDISEEFWQIHQLQDDILFVSSRNIYIYRNEQLIKVAAPSFFAGSFKVNDQIYFADQKLGLFVFEDFSLKKVVDLPGKFNGRIAGIFQHENNLVIVTRDWGLYLLSDGALSPLNNELSAELKAAKVFSFEKIGKSHFAFGTVLRGLYIADMNGKIIHTVNRQKGLPSNTILSLHYSPNGKLWLGMDYGVSSLNLAKNLTYFYDYRGDFGTGHTALLKDDIFYLGTNQGLYRANWDDLNNDSEFARFQLIPATEGQVWTLANIDDQLLIGHDRGLFTLRGNTLKQLSNQDGVWTILPYKDYLLTGNYNGIAILEKSGKNWRFQRKMDLIVGSCNQLLLEKDTVLWINIPNFGVIRAPLDKHLNPTNRLIFGQNSFEESEPYLMKNEAGIQVASLGHLYTFNPAQQKFNKEEHTFERPKVDGLLAGVHEPHKLNSEYNFFPVYNGFALKYLVNSGIHDTLVHHLIIRKTEAFNNHERVLIQPGAKVPYTLNNFKIEYIVPNQDNVLYQFKVKESETWSEWDEENVTEKLNLKSGEHTFWVRAMINGSMTATNRVTFKVAAPWYRTWYAYLIYMLMLGVLVFLVRSRQKSILKRQKRILLAKKQLALQQQAEKHKQEIVLIEQQQLQAEYDQLKQQLKNKTIELANKAREDEEKNRLLISLKEKCETAEKDPTLSKRQWHEMKRMLDSYLNVEDNTFEIQMDELHQEFFRKLKDRFPGLSNNELRLCAYLKIGLNSKEITEILNIQLSSSYISRSRLRKKLNLKTEEDLYDFLNGI